MKKIPSLKEQLRQGLKDVEALNKGKLTVNDLKKNKVKPLKELNANEIKMLREKTLGISQGVLAMVFHISIKTVQSWEIGNTKPSGPSMVLLNLLFKDASLIKRLVA